MLDVGGMAFWSVLGVGLFVAMAFDRNVAKSVLVLEFVPLIFLLFSARDFLNHMRAREIRVQKEGVETPGERCPQLLEWKNVEQVMEKGGYSGGLTLYGRKRERIFIPRAVTGYEEIRAYIVQMTNGQRDDAKTGN
jgi:hypothetical protein